MPNPELDKRLETFLESFERDGRRGDTMANMRLLIGGLASRLDTMGADFQRLTQKVKRHGVRLRALEEHVGFETDDADTGQFEVAALKAQLEEAKRRAESGMWLKRQGIQWLIGGIGAAILVLFSALVAFGFSHLK